MTKSVGFSKILKNGMGMSENRNFLHLQENNLVHKIILKLTFLHFMAQMNANLRPAEHPNIEKIVKIFLCAFIATNLL